MKKLIKIYGVLILMLSLSISCEQQNDIKSANQIQDLTSQVTSSSKFQNLNISLNSISLENSQFITAEKKSLFIPFIGFDDRKGVIAIFSNENKLLAVAFYEMVTNVPADLIYSELKNGSFLGDYVLRTEDGTVEIKMAKSKIIATQVAKSSRSGRTSACNGITQPGGAADCAGARLINMNWYDQAWCYSTFMVCMTHLTISCAIDGCVVGPVL